MSETDSGDRESRRDKRHETLAALLLAVFASALGVTNVGAGRYGGDEILAANEKAQAYLWYQAKSIKETQTEGEADLLAALLDGGAVRPEQAPALRRRVGEVRAKAERYSREKTEILRGSAAVGPQGWVQDVDGELGRVMGALPWERRAVALGKVGDVFDIAVFILELSLVAGAISIVIHAWKLKVAFTLALLFLGLGGVGFAVAAFLQALAVA